MAKPDYLAASDQPAWEKGMGAVAKNTDVRCKLSLSPRGEQVAGLLAKPRPGWALKRIQPCVEFVMEKFAHDRLMWGSDYPIALLTSDYAGTFHAVRRALGTLPPELERQLYRDNALRFYSL
jgi:L-fuconolactonase